jgi:hypothetical protein
MFNSQGFKYAVPALLYAVHNNLIFVALLVIEPVTFELFNNLKIITAAVLFRVVRKPHTLGCSLGGWGLTQ